VEKKLSLTLSVSWVALLSLSYFSLGWAQGTKLTVVTNLGFRQFSPNLTRLEPGVISQS
jgi:hypothetical protein